MSTHSGNPSIYILLRQVLYSLQPEQFWSLRQLEYMLYIYIYGSLCCPWARVTLVKFILQLYSYPHDVTLSKLPRFMYPLINAFYESSVRREDFAKMGSHWISFDNYRTLEESQARWKHSSHPGDIYMSYEHCGILHYMLVIEATLACRSKIAGTHTHLAFYSLWCPKSVLSVWEGTEKWYHLALLSRRWNIIMNPKQYL